MTTLSGRPRTALLVIDVQRGVMEGAHARESVIAAAAAVVEKARAARTPVVWVAHSHDEMPIGAANWEYVPELERAEAEPLVHKRWPDSFDDTDLEEVLAREGVGHLVVVGAQTDECIRATLHGAITRGYDVTLVGDAHSTEDHSQWGAPPPGDVVAHTNLYWRYHEAPGRSAAVVESADVAFA